MRNLLSIGCVVVTLAYSAWTQAQTIRSAVGADAAAITTEVNAFRNDLGTLNANGACTGPCVPGIGRREINWDAVPDSSSDSADFPNDFFNKDTTFAAGRIRGAQFASAGTLRVSADADSDGDNNPGPRAILFDDLAMGNGADFAAFSAERIFGIVGSNEMDVTFAVPGSPGIPALVRGFGAVFTDVEVAGATRLDFYDANNILLHSEAAMHFPLPVGAADTNDSFSFVGVSFASPVVRRVHIVNGTYDLTLDSFSSNTALDVSAMDDFIYGEPIAIPEPATSVLCVLGLILTTLRLRK